MKAREDEKTPNYICSWIFKIVVLETIPNLDKF